MDVAGRVSCHNWWAWAFGHFRSELEARQMIAQRYMQLLADVVKVPQVIPDQVSAYAQYTIEVSNRDAFQTSLEAAHIPTAVHYPIAMHEQPILNSLGYQQGDFPCAERASQRVISLPMHPYLTEVEQREVANAVIQAIKIHEPA